MQLHNRDQLEGSFEKRLNRLSAKHRGELIKLMGNPPDFDNVPQSFWKKVEREREEEILAMLLLLYILSSSQHGAKESQAMSRADLFAKPRASQVAKKYLLHVQNTLRSRLTDNGQKRTEVDTATKPKPNPPSRRQIAFDVFTPASDSTTAITLSTEAESTAAEQAKQETDSLSGLDEWVTEEDARVCPICAPLDGKKRAVWSAKFPQGPPAHPRCRCQIIYSSQDVPAELTGSA